MTREETIAEIRTLIANNIKDLTYKMENNEISSQGFMEKADKLRDLDKNVIIHFDIEYVPLFV